jgi:lipid-binding SYLF domain-containing protein
MNMNRRWLFSGLAGLAGATAFTPQPARAASESQISQDAHIALQRLYASQPKARELGRRAKAILVFPSIIKAGLIIGGQGGDGALIRGGKSIGYYNIAAASFGLQAGAQRFSYALFFMS